MDEFDPISEWFEGSFRLVATPKSRIQRDATRSRSGVSPAKRGGFSPPSHRKAIRENAISVLKKSPEVMVKITKSDYGTKTMKPHLDYISRNGKLELITDGGDSIIGRQGVSDLKEQFKAMGIPLEGNKREFIRCVFSMPAGTPHDEVREATLNFCAEEFSNRRYVVVLHNDTDHVHCHLLVNTRDFEREDEPRLNPNRQDLFRWRQGFAEKLRDLGIDAAASQRKHRFNHLRSEHTSVRQIRAENPKSSKFNQKRHDTVFKKRLERAKKTGAFVGPYRGPRTPTVHKKLKEEILSSLKTGKIPANPAGEKIRINKQEVKSKWEEVKTRLQENKEKKLEALVVELLKKEKNEPLSRNQAIFNHASKKESIKPIEKDNGLEI